MWATLLVAQEFMWWTLTRRSKTCGYQLSLLPGEGELEIWHCKLRSYVKLKADYGETEGYVQRTRVKVHGSLLAHLRWRTAPLQIETGRYIFFPVEERTCETCNSGMVEDEEHFCVGCPGNQRPSAQVDGASSCTQDFGRCRTRKNSSE